VLGRRSSGTGEDISPTVGEEEIMAVVTIDLPGEIYATLRRSSRELALDVRLAAAILGACKGEGTPRGTGAAR